MSKRKLKKKRLIIFIVLLYLIFILIKNFPNFINFHFFSGYKIIKQDTNSNYSGIGQTKVKNQDGYFETFTTENNEKTYIEYKQNGNASWAQNEYWGGTMEENGCGITAISIILSGYGKKLTPENLRKKYYPVLNSEKISPELSSFGIENSDFYFDSKHLSSESIEEHLQSNRPILICVWNKPQENRWTSASHYMVLLATDGKGKVYVSNPNGSENDSKSSGWYKISEITTYLAKALYIESF